MEPLKQEALTPTASAYATDAAGTVSPKKGKKDTVSSASFLSTKKQSGTKARIDQSSKIQIAEQILEKGIAQIDVLEMALLVSAPL